MRARERGFIRSILRQATRQPRTIATFAVGGFLLGVVYRFSFEPIAERSVSNYALSGIHGVGLVLTAWIVQASFGRGGRSSVRGWLRRVPLALEVFVRAAATTAALIVVGLALQFILYAESQHLHWLSRHWLTVELPRIVASAFALSLVVGLFTEASRLIGSQMLISVLLGTYHRPAKQPLIVMFLDITKSTSLAEAMGELRVHDLITSFFYDIDEPISDSGGIVHSYVGDEVIVTWPLTADAKRNARALECFFAVKRKMTAMESQYVAEFGVALSFRAGIHAGPVIVSECGDAKRQLAYYGDTMNVTARLCDYGRTIDERLVVSGDFMRLAALPDDLAVYAAEHIQLRGRAATTEALAIRQR